MNQETTQQKTNHQATYPHAANHPKLDRKKWLEKPWIWINMAPEGEPRKAFAAADVAVAVAITAVGTSTVSTMEVKMSDAKPVEATPVRSFSARQRKIVLNRQARCQHIDPLTKKQCQGSWFLQVDHKHSAWAGGSSTH